MDNSFTDIRISYRDWITPAVKIARLLGPAMLVCAWFFCNYISPTDFPELHRLILSVGMPDPEGTAKHLMFMLAMIIVCLSGLITNFALLTGEQRIVVSADSISFPLLFVVDLHNRRQRAWRDVGSVRVISGKALLDTKIVMFFKSGGRACVELRCLPQEQIEQLGLAIEVRANDADTTELAAFLDVLHQGKAEGGELSYTRLWEEEMNSKFSSVSFIPLVPGQVLANGDIKIERQLAFGGLSAVYLGQTPDRERVVVKEIALPANSDSSACAKAKELLLREASLLLKISHPQIVPIRRVFVENERTYLVVDYVPGENLRQIVRHKGPVADDIALDWANQLTKIIAYLHGREPPILHRDISPDNVIIGADGKLVLIDFGVANEFMSSATGTMVGKQSYVAPEQFQGRATRQSDLYSLGATLFFLVTGRDPEPLSQSRLGDEKLGASEKIDEFIKLCTSLDTATRLQSAEEALELLCCQRVDGSKLKLDFDQLQLKLDPVHGSKIKLDERVMYE